MLRLLILLIIIFALWLLWPRIRNGITRWILSRIQKQAFRYMHDAAGVPPGDEKPREKKRRSSRRTSDQSRPHTTPRSGPIIPKEYAVDAEFVEIHEYSSSTVIGEDTHTGQTREWHESQVTDAEWVEIRDSHK